MNLASALGEMGHEVTVFTTGPRKAPGEDATVSPNVQIVRLGNVKFASFAFKAAKIGDSFDIVHSQGGARVSSARLDVETVHHVPLSWWESLNALPNMISAWRSKRVISVSESTRRELCRTGLVSPGKIRVVHNGIGKEFLDALKRTKTSSQRTRAYALLCVISSLEKRKNFGFALRVLSALRESGLDCELRVAGPSSIVTGVRTMVATSRVEDAVKIFPNLSVAELARLYVASDVLIVPSIKEGFCFPMVEATAAGIPFVSFDVGVSEFLAGAGFGSVCKTKDEFVANTKKMLGFSGPGKAKGMDFVVRNFSWETSAVMMTEIYDEIQDGQDISAREHD